MALKTKGLAPESTLSDAKWFETGTFLRRANDTV